MSSTDGGNACCSQTFTPQRGRTLTEGSGGGLQALFQGICCVHLDGRAGLGAAHECAVDTRVQRRHHLARPPGS